jgi:hypothetical protein
VIDSTLAGIQNSCGTRLDQYDGNPHILQSFAYVSVSATDVKEHRLASKLAYQGLNYFVAISKPERGFLNLKACIVPFCGIGDGTEV